MRQEDDPDAGVDHDVEAEQEQDQAGPGPVGAHQQEQRRSEAAGFALRAIQLAAVATYFLSAWAKIRFGGWNWPTGATLTRAVVRRGTSLSEWTLAVPYLLPAAQWLMIGFELASPLILLVRSDRARIGLVMFLIGFHVMVFAGVGIIFLPHCIAILSILPWERLTARQLQTHPGEPTVPVTSNAS